MNSYRNNKNNKNDINTKDQNKNANTNNGNNTNINDGIESVLFNIDLKVSNQIVTLAVEQKDSIHSLLDKFNRLTDTPTVKDNSALSNKFNNNRSNHMNHNFNYNDHQHPQQSMNHSYNYHSNISDNNNSKLINKNTQQSSLYLSKSNEKLRKKIISSLSAYLKQLEKKSIKLRLKNTHIQLVQKIKSLLKEQQNDQLQNRNAESDIVILSDSEKREGSSIRKKQTNNNNNQQYHQQQKMNNNTKEAKKFEQKQPSQMMILKPGIKHKNDSVNENSHSNKLSSEKYTPFKHLSLEDNLQSKEKNKQNNSIAADLLSNQNSLYFEKQKEKAHLQQNKHNIDSKITLNHNINKSINGHKRPWFCNQESKILKNSNNIHKSGKKMDDDLLKAYEVIMRKCKDKSMRQIAQNTLRQINGQQYVKRLKNESHSSNNYNKRNESKDKNRKKQFQILQTPIIQIQGKQNTVYANITENQRVKNRNYDAKSTKQLKKPHSHSRYQENYNNSYQSGINFNNRSGSGKKRQYAYSSLINCENGQINQQPQIELVYPYYEQISNQEGSPYKTYNYAITTKNYKNISSSPYKYTDDDHLYGIYDDAYGRVPSISTINNKNNENSKSIKLHKMVYCEQDYKNHSCCFEKDDPIYRGKRYQYRVD